MERTRYCIPYGLGMRRIFPTQLSPYAEILSNIQICALVSLAPDDGMSALACSWPVGTLNPDPKDPRTQRIGL